MENTIQESRWYIIHTYSAYEDMVRSYLLTVIENNKLQDQIEDVVIPTEEDIVERNGKKKTILRKKFPAYVFLKMIYTKELGYMITSIRGVTGFVGPQSKAVPLTDDEVKKMRLEKIEIQDLDMEVGDNVKIISGALENFIGAIEEINIERQKLKVIVSMFGRETPVELDFIQVEKL
ncbi:MAG: transcription termination/antitermination protein NusG [Clostridia bacterium]